MGLIKKMKKFYGSAILVPEALEKIIHANQQIDSLRDRIEEISLQKDESIRALSQELDRQEKINELYFYTLFRDDDEEAEAMRKRFFRKVPKADGKTRLLQKANAKLISDFDKICTDNKIEYWMCGGTLLGAVRNGGCIPWDDDIDVAMMRDEISKLREVLEKTDSEYTVTEFYQSWNLNKQLRFRPKAKANPCFLDIFIYDYGTRAGEQEWQRWLEDKRRIIAEIHEKPVDAKFLDVLGVWSDEKTSLARKVRSLFEEYYGDITGKRKEGGPGGVTNNPELAKYVLWASDNFIPIANPQNSRIYDRDIVFPLKRIAYEGKELLAPNDSDAFLRVSYGDYYRLPKDIVSHFQHVNLDELDVDLINEYINKEA